MRFTLLFIVGVVAMVPTVGGVAAMADGAVFQETEPNDYAKAANEVTSNCNVNATVKAARDTDCFRLRIEKPTFLRAAVTGVAGVDFTLHLTDGNNKRIMTLNGQGVGKGERLLRRVRRGSYVLNVTARVIDKAGIGKKYRIELREVVLKQYDPSIEQIKAAIKRGLTFLASKQDPDGSWPVKVGPHGVTGLAMMGFVAEKLPEFKETVEKSATFFRKSYVPAGKHPRNPTAEARIAGSLVGTRCGHFMYEQAIAVLAMSEYVHHKKDDATRKMVAHGVKLLLNSQNSSRKPKDLRGPIDAKAKEFGGWRYRADGGGSDLSVSGWCLIALAAAETAGFKIPPDVRKDFMVYCRNCWSEKNKGYQYQAPTGRMTNTTNAVGVLTTLMCVGGECDVVRKGLRTIRANFPNWESEGGLGKYPFYYWYYASRAMYVAGGDYWKQWRGAIVPMLLKFQNEDGSWDAVLDEEKVGPEYTTSLAVLILQLCSGNPPAYLHGLDLKTENYPCERMADDVESLIKKAKRDRTTKEELIGKIEALLERLRGE